MEFKYIKTDSDYKASMNTATGKDLTILGECFGILHKLLISLRLCVDFRRRKYILESSLRHIIDMSGLL